MRKIMIILSSIVVIACFASQKSSVDAAALANEAYCKDSVITPVHPEYIPEYWTYTAEKEKASTNFILDYFQDPQKHGVSINVTISTMDLIATYSKWGDVCTPYDSVQPGMSACDYKGKFEPGFHHAYWTRTCVEQPPELTYRPIETGTISIWLEPTEDTRKLLGPGPYYKDTNKPVLRYLYPDQWALVVVRPGERRIIERPWFHNSEDVERFLRENKDFIIMDTSVKDYDLTSRLRITLSPTGKGGGLAIYSLGNNCSADLKDISDFDGHEVCPPFTTEGKTGYGTKIIKMMFDRIPLDMPGEWYVGVSFYQWPAKFDEGRSEEDTGTGLYREFVFSDEQMEKQFSFESYIIRSAPCNPDEPGSCWEEEKPSE